MSRDIRFHYTTMRIATPSSDIWLILSPAFADLHAITSLVHRF